MSKRKFLTPAQKIAIVREHLIDGVPVSGYLRASILALRSV